MEHPMYDLEEVDEEETWELFYDVLEEFETGGEEEDDDTLDHPTVDQELEDFLRRLAKEGRLLHLRDQGKLNALQRKDSIVSLRHELSSSDFSTEMSSEADDLSNATELDDQEKLEAGSVRDRLWRLGLRFKDDDHENGMVLNDSPEDDGGGNGAPLVTNADLVEFLSKIFEEQYLKRTDGWSQGFDQSADTFEYFSWVRDPPDNGPTQYFSRMVFHNCPPETVRDFLLDENHRLEWDRSRASYYTLEDWDDVGRQVVSWVRRLPFFLKDREYVVSRRVWALEDNSVACISKSTQHPSYAKKSHTWGVVVFISCWRLRGVKNPATGELSTEVYNFHAEDSGFPRNWARMAVMRNLWPYIAKMERALREYQTNGRTLQHSLPNILSKEWRKTNSLPHQILVSN